MCQYLGSLEIGKTAVVWEWPTLIRDEAPAAGKQHKSRVSAVSCYRCVVHPIAAHCTEKVDLPLSTHTLPPMRTAGSLFQRFASLTALAALRCYALTAFLNWISADL